MAFWPEDDVNHLRLVYTTRYAERKPGLDESGLLTRHNFILSVDLYVQKKVQKAFPDNRGWASHWTGFPHDFSYSEFPSGALRLAMSNYWPWLLRPMQEGAQGGAPLLYKRMLVV